jgi:hypothetical protein
MKNKNINETVALMMELQKLKGNKDYAYAYCLGMCQGIINSAVHTSLQECIDSTYINIQAEIDWLRKEKLESLKKTCNKASIEELYA